MIAGNIKITEIQSNEDGSARVILDMDEETYHDIFEYGFIQLINSILLTNTEAWKQMTDNDWPLEADFTDVRPMTPEERKAALDREKANKRKSNDQE